MGLVGSKEQVRTMTWTLKPKPNPADPTWEPVELIVLKQKLAKLSSSICKCLASRSNMSYVAFPVHVNPLDKEVQVEEQKSNSFDRFTQATQDSIRKDREELTNFLTKDVLCPSCFVTMNLLRGGALKILKDEEAETNYDMFSCDKATENMVKSVEKTTSFTVKPNVMFSNVSMYDLCESNSSLLHNMRRRPYQVKFGDIKMNTEHQTSRITSPPCFCLEKFVDSIRPPIHSYAY